MATQRQSVTPAIVLRRRSVGEKDRSVLLFTKFYGILWATARGVKSVRSRRASHLEPFNISVVTLHMNGSFSSITDATALSMFGIKSTSFLKTRAFYLVSEIIERLIPPGVTHPDSFELFVQTFSDIDSSEERDVPNILAKSLTVFLMQLGYLGEGKIQPLKDILSTIESIIERKLKTIDSFRSSHIT